MNIMSALGYRYTKRFAGIAYMGMQTFLAGDKIRFNDRLKLIDDIKEQFSRLNRADDKSKIIDSYKNYFDSLYKRLRMHAIDYRIYNIREEDTLFDEINFSIQTEFDLIRKISLKTEFYRLQAVAIKNSENKIEIEKKFNKIYAELVNHPDKEFRLSKLSSAELKEWEESGYADEINSLKNIEIEVEKQCSQLLKKDMADKVYFLYKKDNGYIDKF